MLRCLLEGLRWLSGAGTDIKVAGKSGISQARKRLGWEPIRELHDDLGLLSYLALERHVSAATQNQAKAALLFRVPPVGVRDLIDGVRYVHEVQEVDSWGRALQNRRRGS